MMLRLVPGIHRATHRIGIYLADLREFGLSQGEAHILAQLHDGGPATIAQLHRGLAHRRSTLTSILDRLVERRLVERDVSSADRRSFLVTPTPRGRQVSRRVHRHLQELEGAVAAAFSPEELRTFEKVLAVVEHEADRRTGRAPGRAQPRKGTRPRRR